MFEERFDVDRENWRQLQSPESNVWMCLRRYTFLHVYMA